MKEHIEKINTKIALTVTYVVGTMWCAYLFAILAVLSLPTAINGGIATLISWIAQTFLQLVLLSVIMVGQRIQSEKTEARDEQDHQTIMSEFAEIKEMHNEIKEILVLEKQDAAQEQRNGV